MNEFGPVDFPLVVAVGGTLRPGSSTEQALRVVLDAAARLGARTCLLSGESLNVPLYAPHDGARSEGARALVEALRRADAVVLGSPGYHGSVSGLVKNALDYTEDLREDPQPYLSGRAVACVATGGGWQGAVHTLGALRDVVHALRGWNTPLGVAINTSLAGFGPTGRCVDERLHAQLEALGRELVDFARRHAPVRASA